jgi:hypothetical protein
MTDGVANFIEEFSADNLIGDRHSQYLRDLGDSAVCNTFADVNYQLRARILAL